jgi:hypothetical protein
VQNTREVDGGADELVQRVCHGPDVLFEPVGEFTLETAVERRSDIRESHQWCMLSGGSEVDISIGWVDRG